MANINTLFKKGYLLAGVVMAANMFVVNEVKAMDGEKHIDEEENNGKKDEASNDKCTKTILYKISDKIHIQNFIGFVESFIGTLALSYANNYFKWWDYDEGIYWKLGCLGWRFKSFLNGMFQFEVNLNFGRLIFCLINFCGITFIKVIKKRLDPKDLIPKVRFHTVQGLVSIPLTLHLSKFSISISLDSIIWMGIFKLLDLKAKKDVEKPAEISLTISQGYVKNGGTSDNGEIYD